MRKSLRTEFEEGIRPGGEADAGGVIGSCEFPPQGLQEAEGHGCWTLAGADSHAGHIPRRRNAETKDDIYITREQTRVFPSRGRKRPCLSSGRARPPTASHLYAAFTLSPRPDLPGTVPLPHILCAVEQYLPVTVRDHSE